MTAEPIDPSNRQIADDPRYQRAARLLAQKLGIDWRDLPAEQVNDYLRKIEIARRVPQPASGRPTPYGRAGLNLSIARKICFVSRISKFTYI